MFLLGSQTRFTHMCITYKGFEIHYAQGSQLLEEYVPPVVVINANLSADPEQEQWEAQEMSLPKETTISEAYKVAKEWIDEFCALASQSDFQNSDQEQLRLQHHKKELLPQCRVHRKFPCHNASAIAQEMDSLN